jgi:hypothetical protein
MARAKLQDLLNVSRGSARGAEVCKLREVAAAGCESLLASAEGFISCQRPLFDDRRTLLNMDQLPGRKSCTKLHTKGGAAPARFGTGSFKHPDAVEWARSTTLGCRISPTGRQLGIPSTFKRGE